MLRKILIVVFSLVFVLGVVFMFRGRPKVDVGRVEISSSNKKIEAKAVYVSTRYNDKYETTDAVGVKDILDDIPSITQKVDKNAKGDEIKSDIKVSFYESYYGDVFYTVYDKNGDVLRERSTTLKLPANEKTDGCIIMVKVFWGKEKNYEEYDYYFAVDYKYE